MPSYPQAGHFAVDNMENNFAGETETASTQCMEAVILSGGEGERRRVPPGQFVFRQLLAVEIQIEAEHLCCNCEKNRVSCMFCNSP
ncbi:MAG: hypothetical protein CFE36_06945 [Sphingomonadaceae bacterium PASS1]|nr:MAG: hypothetical protein CFE36_06945 [Sphingomonadaceae bacterium PASS1]